MPRLRGIQAGPFTMPRWRRIRREILDAELTGRKEVSQAAAKEVYQAARRKEEWMKRGSNLH
jgi:hypothetical protein